MALNTLPPYEDRHAQMKAMVKQPDTRCPGARTAQQNDAARRLDKLCYSNTMACLQGPAGYDKSKIALHYLLALENSLKNCPLRVAVTAMAAPAQAVTAQAELGSTGSRGTWFSAP